MLRIQIDGVTATITEQELLTAGRVGLECGFSFSGEWDGLFKTAVFEGNQTIDVALTGDTCVVPWEALEVEGFQLRVGVYGANSAGTIVIPTVWAKFNKIQPSAVPSGNSPATPTQSANAYAVETSEQALAIAQSVRTDADNGVFIGPQGPQGEQGPTGPQGPTGDPGVYIGSDAPTDPDVDVWIDVDGEADSIDYSNLTNKPQINSVTLSGNKTAAALGLGTYSKPSGGIPKTDLASAVQTSLGKADTALQSAPVSSVDGKTGAVTILPSGGTTGQVLAKASGTDYDAEWVDQSGGSSVSPYTSDPSALGTASPGSSGEYARGDHVHPMPVVAYSDLTAGVRASLDKADTAYQKPTLGVPDSDIQSAVEWNSKYFKPPAGIPATDLASAVQTSLGLADTALQSYTETDPTVPSWAKAASKPSYTASEVGAEQAVTEVTNISDGAVSAALDAGKIYHFTGALTSLTIALNAASGVAQYHFDFDSGATAPSVVLPNTVIMPDGHSFEANNHYEVDILNNYGVVAAWALS